MQWPDKHTLIQNLLRSVISCLCVQADHILCCFKMFHVLFHCKKKQKNPKKTTYFLQVFMSESSPQLLHPCYITLALAILNMAALCMWGALRLQEGKHREVPAGCTNCLWPDLVNVAMFSLNAVVPLFIALLLFSPDRKHLCFLNHWKKLHLLCTVHTEPLRRSLGRWIQLTPEILVSFDYEQHLFQSISRSFMAKCNYTWFLKQIHCGQIFELVQ